TVTFPDGTTATGKADDEGNYTIEIPENVTLTGGEVIQVTSRDEAGNESEGTQVAVSSEDLDADSDSKVSMGPGSGSDSNGGNGTAKAATINDDRDGKGENKQSLPDTGEQPLTNTTLFSGLLAGLGSLFLLGRRKKDYNENN
ncbi:Ig-like domain-containing protein, partial [Mammaliicoccus vitulinus]